jgi:prepilin-type N-terminal cleavage/methylation domain-containing protein
MFKRARKRGFTLVELLVVMGIIALLMTLLVPTITKAVEVVKKDRTLSEFKDLGLSIQSFRNDWGDIPPSKPNDGTASSGAMSTGAANLAYYLLGPGGSGWGTAGGGAMPFGGTPTRAYGPYYQVESEYLGYEKPASGDFVLSGFLDGFKGGYWDISGQSVPRGRILYFKYDLTLTTSTPLTAVGYTVSDNGSDSTGQTNYGSPNAFIEGVTGQNNYTNPTWPRQDYLLISPGPDGRYGYTKTDSSGNIVPAALGDAGIITPLDDIVN